MRGFDVKEMPLRGMAGYGGGASYSTYDQPEGEYIVGNYYPIFCFKANDDSNSPDPPGIPSVNCGIPFRRMLSFDTANTQQFNENNSRADIFAICDTYIYTCNPGMRQRSLSGVKLEHWQSSGTTMYNDAEVLFNGSAFNIYDHACNASTNLGNSLPSQMGSITLARVNSTSTTSSGQVFVNCSNNTSRVGTDGWTSDSGDYCFFGISDRPNAANANDNLDKEFATNEGIAFGISDSDGCPASGQAPRLGWSKRSTGYLSAFTNWQQRDEGLNPNGGATSYGYFILYGKVK